MKSLILLGLVVSVLLAGASFLITSGAPDGLEKVIEPPEEEEDAASPWRDGLLGAAGVILVFTVILGYGTWRKGRDAPRVP
jgi:hypothetical protein